MATHTSINNFLNLTEQNINIDQLIEDFIQFVKTVGWEKIHTTNYYCYIDTINYLMKSGGVTSIELRYKYAQFAHNLKTTDLVSSKGKVGIVKAFSTRNNKFTVICDVLGNESESFEFNPDTDFFRIIDPVVREIRKLVKECDSATFNGVQVTKNNINIEDNILFIYYYSDVYDSLIKVSTPLNEISKLQNNYYQLKSGTIKFHKMIDIKCENDTVSVV